MMGESGVTSQSGSSRGRRSSLVSRLSRGAKGAAGRVASIAGYYRRRFSSQVVVTAFHRVNDLIPEDGVTCSSAKFERFCEFFLAHFRVLPFSKQVSSLRSGFGVSGTLSITFDDGYLDNYEVAVPILQRYKLPATFFIATDFIGTEKVAPWDKGLSHPMKWMDWRHVREISDSGFEIGCHTASHLDMGVSDRDTIKQELIRSKGVLEDKLGKPIRLFAYPFGGRKNISASALDVVQELGFECCASCYGGVNGAATNPYEIKRVGIAEWFLSPHQFGFELATGRV